MRLNVDARGKFLGEFSGDDKILVITKSGHFRTCGFDLSNHFEDDLSIIEKFRPNKIWSAAYYDADQEYYYLKRFRIESNGKTTCFIGDNPESRLIRITEVEYPRLELKFGGKNRDRSPEIIEVADFIGVKSYKARGKRLSNYEVKVIEELEPQIDQSETSAEETGKIDPMPAAEKKEGKDPGPAAKKKEGKDPKPAVDKKPEKDAGPQKEGKSEGKKKGKTGKPAAKSIQNPDDVPMEVIKPTEEKKGNKKGDSEKPSGQFTLEW